MFENSWKIIFIISKNLNLEIINSKLGKAYLIGIPFQVLEDKESAIEEIKKLETVEEVKKCLATLSGDI